MTPELTLLTQIAGDMHVRARLSSFLYWILAGFGSFVFAFVLFSGFRKLAEYIF